MVRFIDALVYLYQHQSPQIAFEKALSWSNDKGLTRHEVEQAIIKKMRSNRNERRAESGK